MSNSFPLETGYGGSWYRRGCVLSSFFYDDGDAGDEFAIQFFAGVVKVHYAYLRNSDDWSDFNAALARAKKLASIYQGRIDELQELSKDWARPLLADAHKLKSGGRVSE
jgi:hypothetical protein